MRLPEAVRAMYRVHDGQELPADVLADTTGECQLDSPSTLHGIFGGCDPAVCAACGAAAVA